MVAIHRRTFLERAALGAGAVVLTPIARMLVSEARGAVVARKRLLIVMQGCGMDWVRFVPPELRGKGVDVAATNATRTTPTPLFVRQSSDFTLPPMLQSLAPFKDKILLLDGLANRQYDGGAGAHTAMFSALSCVPPTSVNVDVTTPGGITFDQHLAGKVGGGYPFKTIGLGCVPNYHFERNTVATALASGANQPIPHQTSPKEALARLFGATAPPGGSTASPLVAPARGRLLFDFMRDDVKRLQTALAGAERRKLDEYLSSLEAVEKRQAALVDTAKTCGSPMVAAGGSSSGTDDAKIAAQIEIGTAALLCGLSPIVTINSFTGPHFDTSNFSQVPGVRTHTLGHLEGQGLGGLDRIHDFHAGLLAKAAQRLGQVREGDRTAFDNTLVMFCNDNGGTHHQGQSRWPVVLLGNAGGALRVDGRYIKFPMKHLYTGERGLGDLYRTIEQVFTGAPSVFAERSLSPVRGPLEEVLA